MGDGDFTKLIKAKGWKVKDALEYWGRGQDWYADNRKGDEFAQRRLKCMIDGLDDLTALIPASFKGRKFLIGGDVKRSSHGFEAGDIVKNTYPLVTPLKQEVDAGTHAQYIQDDDGLIVVIPLSGRYGHMKVGYDPEFTCLVSRREDIGLPKTNTKTLTPECKPPKPEGPPNETIKTDADRIMDALFCGVDKIISKIEGVGR